MTIKHLPHRPCKIPVLAIAASLWACGDDTGGDLQEPLAVSTVTVSAPATTLQVDQMVQLTATASDAGGTRIEGVTFEWTTSDQSVATVSQTGLLTGLTEGEAEITASTEGVSGSVLISVATSAPPPTPGGVGLQEVAMGLNFPVYLTGPPGDERLFIVEKGGAIRVVKGGTLLEPAFLDLSGQLATRREEGLLGLAFSPDYATSGRFFVHYTHISGDIRISQFTVSADPDRADPSSESVVLTIKHPGVSHNGGQILFGPDGYLYISVGDGGSRNGEDRGRGQSLADLLGNILRIDVSSAVPYVAPPDNPYAGTPGTSPEVWSYGLRNPWRFSFDRATGDLYITDVGEKRWEEVNVSLASEGAGRGINYGWSLMEGPDCMQEGCDRGGLTLPVLSYDHDSGCSVTGGYVYRGSRIPTLQGHYLYADFCRGWVRSFRLEGGEPVENTDRQSLYPGGLVTSFGEDTDGELYILTLDGRALKIVPQ